MRYLAWLMALGLGSTSASAQQVFELQFDHATVLVSDLDASAAFYEEILHLEGLETPFGPSAPIRFYALGGNRQLHVGQADERNTPIKNLHLAFAVRNFDAYLTFLRAQGIAYSNFPGNSTNPQVRSDGIKQVYLQDPDGNWIEINDVAHPPP